VESKDTNQPPKSEKCKRKSGSSEVIEFLKQYVDEQKKKVKKKKKKRMKMHNEKMGLFRDLIKEMKK